jgi:hypothetical protein
MLCRRARAGAGGGGRGQAPGMSATLHLTSLMLADLVLGTMDTCKLSPPQPGRGGGGGAKGASGGGRQHYPGSRLVGQDVGVEIWSTACGPFLWSLKEGIMATAAMAGATLPMMTKRAATIASEKDRASYHALFRDLEGCGSYVRDFGIGGGR